MALGPLDDLRVRVAGEPDAAGRVEAMLLGLADIIKTTSNDQNVQRLSRELRAAVVDLSKLIVDQV